MPQAAYARLGGLRLLLCYGVQSESLRVNGLRVALGALPWSPTRAGGRDPLADVTWAPEDCDVAIFVFHQSIEGHVYPAPHEAIVAHASLDRLERTQLVVAGHVHQHACWEVGSQTVLIPGATEQMTFGETGEPGFSVVAVAPGGVVRHEHVRVACQPRRRLRLIPAALREDGDDLCAAVLRRLDPWCSPDALLRLHLEGPVSREEYQALDLHRLWEFGAARAFYFDVDASELVVEDDFGPRPSGGVRLTLREELTACADALLAETADLAERSLLEDTRRELLACYEAGEPA
jgi:DNA repair exonuclease SbcCD nuclease subunit